MRGCTCGPTPTSTSPSPSLRWRHRPARGRPAGRHGIGLLSVGATLTPDGFDALAHHWNVVEERASTFGTTVDREKWRLVSLFHVAETREQAYRDVDARHQAVVRLLPGRRGIPADGRRGQHQHPRDDRLRQRGRDRSLRHARGRAEPSAAARRPVRWLRVDAAARARVGQPGCDQAAHSSFSHST